MMQCNQMRSESVAASVDSHLTYVMVYTAAITSTYLNLLHTSKHFRLIYKLQSVTNSIAPLLPLEYFYLTTVTRD